MLEAPRTTVTTCACLEGEVVTALVQQFETMRTVVGRGVPTRQAWTGLDGPGRAGRWTESDHGSVGCGHVGGTWIGHEHRNIKCPSYIGDVTHAKPADGRWCL